MTTDSRLIEDSPVAQEALEAQLILEIEDRLHIQIPGPDAELLESGIIDSLAFVELLLIFDNEFGVAADIADLDMDNFQTVRHIARFIIERQQSETAAPR